MREKHKLKKLAEQRFKPLCDEISAQLECEFPELAESEKKKTDSVGVKKKRIAWVSSLTAALCCCVVLLCVFLIPSNHDDGAGGGILGGGLTTDPEYSIVDSDVNIGRYNEVNNTDILYFDWYSEADRCSTKLYVTKDAGVVIGVEETIKNPSMPGSVYLYSVNSGITVAEIDGIAEKCKLEKDTDNGKIKWGIDNADVCCTFEYKNRQYALLLENGDDSMLFELVGELFR